MALITRDQFGGMAANDSPVPVRTLAQADKIIICTGGTSRPLAVPGFDLTATHSDAWHLSSVPLSLLVIGAGATGVQVASIFNAFGTHVHLIEIAPRILIPKTMRFPKPSAPSWPRPASKSARTPGRLTASSAVRSACGSPIRQAAGSTASTPRSPWSRPDGSRPLPGGTSTGSACKPTGAGTSRWTRTCARPRRTSYDEPAPSWTLVLRRQSVHLMEGRPDGGYTHAGALVCGDNPDLVTAISPDVERIRGPYRFSAATEAYGQHDRLQHGQPTVPAANGTRRRTGRADGETR